MREVNAPTHQHLRDSSMPIVNGSAAGPIRSALALTQAR
jgi:hypothetical protein